MPRIAITVRGQATQPYRFPLDRAITHIGRHVENDVIVPCDSISRAHCCLRRVPGGFILEDHGSTNGVAIKGQLYEVIDLEHKLTVQLSGKVVLKYTLTSEELAELAKEKLEKHQQIARPENPPLPTKRQLAEMNAATTRVAITPYDGTFWHKHLSPWVLYTVLALLCLTFGMTFRHFHQFLFP